MKKILKIVLICFVFTFAIFGVACGQQNSAGNNNTGNSAEVPVVPEENLKPEDDTEEGEPNEGEEQPEEKPNEEDKTEDEPSDSQTPTEEDKPEDPVDPEMQLALEIENYLSKLVEENFAMISMMTNVTTKSYHDNNIFVYTITFSSSEDYQIYSMMIDEFLLQPNYDKCKLTLTITQSSPNLILTYTIV